MYKKDLSKKFGERFISLYDCYQTIIEVIKHSTNHQLLTHTHTHTNLDLTEARDSEWQ